ncbi:autotransporter outer membrane beta-barrel domain-containing protein [Aquamicrobium segne]|uniref:Autotransporter outer membrane beta-barrel domain-containing protein n=1 Tax=Aquamicrobium segne TaxID=469547 RepID=A0ABW0GYI2_9HYPH
MMTVGPVGDPTQATTRGAWYYMGVENATLTLTDDANIVYVPYGNRFLGIHVTGVLPGSPTQGASLLANNIFLDLTANRIDTEKIGIHVDNGATLVGKDVEIDIALNNSSNSVGYGIVVGTGQYNSIPNILDPTVEFSKIYLDNININIDNSASTQRSAVAAGIRAGQYVSSSGEIGTSGYLSVAGNTVISTSGYYSPGIYISGGDSQVHLNDSNITTKGDLSHAIKLGKERSVLTGSAQLYSYGHMKIDTTNANNTSSIHLMGDNTLIDAGFSGSSGEVRSAGTAVHFANDEGLFFIPLRSASDNISAHFNNTIFETTSTSSSLFRIDAGQTNAMLALRGNETIATAANNGWLMEVQNSSAWGNRATSAVLKASDKAQLIGLTTHGTSNSRLDIDLDSGALWKLAARGNQLETFFTTLNLSDGALLDAGGTGITPASFIATGNISNSSGRVGLENSFAGDIFTVNGSYSAGASSVIEMDVALGDDLSEKDFLQINGNTAGNGLVQVFNAGGLGAQTDDGIKIIDVNGLSAATFSLLGDYVFEGDQAVVGGAYAYRLYQGAASDLDDGHWYLRSSLIPTDPETPLYQPGVPVYESYAQSLLGLNGLNTLQQRVGNRFWSGDGNRVIAQGADTIGGYAPAEEAGTYADGNGVWGRIEGAHNKVDPKFSSSGTDYSQNVFKMQAGVDMALSEAESGTLIGGVFAHYTHGKTNVRSIYGDGTISTDGYGFGGSLTWYGNEGFYVDGQGQVTWYDSDLASTLAHTGLVSGNKGFGYALSLETGKRFAITPEWSLTPQAQLTYSNVDFDSFRDVWNTHISLDRGSRFEGRLGLSLDHESSWQNAAGMTDRAHVYGIANLYYGFSEGTRVNVANTQFSQKQERLWGGLGVGGSYNWNDDKYSIYGEGLVNTSLNNFGDSYTLKGNVGFRVKW